MIVLHVDQAALDPEYWLRNCTGFVIESHDGEPVGVVEEVCTDLFDRAVRLDVSTGWFGRRRVSVAAEDVVGVLPSSRRLVVRQQAESTSANAARA